MKEMTDRELTDKLRRALDDYEDPSTDYGWQELRKKYPGNTRKPVALWWSATAAALLIFSGLWFILPEWDVPRGQIVTKEPLAEQENTRQGKEAPEYAEIAPAGGNPVRLHGSSPQRENRPDQALLAMNQENQLPQLLPDTLSPATPGHISETALISNSPFTNNPDPLTHVTAQSKDLARPYQPAQDGFAAQVPAFDPPAAAEEEDKGTVGFSFFAGSFFNYAEGSETTLNFGAGFSSDIRLTSNLKLSTGISIANNRLSYQDHIPSATARRSASLALDSAPSGSAAINKNSNLTTITRYNADILSLDIPINLKYLIIPREDKLYISAGISSGTYLNETYAFNYRNYSTISGNYVDQGQGEETIRSQFGVFDLARTLNFSLGLNTPLNKSQDITIEPFVKYPLGGIGSENLRFGSTGINLKLSFSPERKK